MSREEKSVLDRNDAGYDSADGIMQPMQHAGPQQRHGIHMQKVNLQTLRFSKGIA